METVDENDDNKAACQEVAGVEELPANLSLKAAVSWSLLNMETLVLADRGCSILRMILVCLVLILKYFPFT